MQEGRSSKKFHGFDIFVRINLEGTGRTNIDTGIGFLNHMLDLFAKHGGFDLSITCKGDLDIDDHHTIDEVGMNLGLAFKEAVKQINTPIQRFGFFVLPMDEVLTTASVDIKANRSSFVFQVPFVGSNIGSLATASIREFWSMFSQKSEINLICKSEFGFNDHHIAEGLFKSIGHALKMSLKPLEVKI